MTRGLQRALSVACALGALLAGGWALGSTGDTRDLGTTDGPSVAVWSARRAPHELAGAAGLVRLDQEVRALGAGSVTCFSIRAGTERIYEHAAYEPMVPASTQKLFVAAAALSRLGYDHRFETVAAVTQPGPATTVDRVWLVGGGDPLLAVRPYAERLDREPRTTGHPSTSLEQLADTIVAAGIREVANGVVGDTSRHTGPPTIPTWEATYVRGQHVTHLSALTVNGGFRLSESGRVTVPDPALEAAEQLTILLEERGVTVGGPSSTDAAPADVHVVGRVQSAPLSEVVEAMLRASDNLIAELLVREIGLAVKGEGDTPAGTEAVVETLRDMGVGVEGIVMNDGSGLDRGNRATCASMVETLLVADASNLDSVGRGLAVAGRTGTLHRRFTGTSLEGRLRAKTGSLRGVAGLTGVVDPVEGSVTEGEKDRALIRFAAVSNGADENFDGSGFIDAVGRILIGFPFEVDDPEMLGPPVVAAMPATTGPVP